MIALEHTRHALSRNTVVQCLLRRPRVKDPVQTELEVADLHPLLHRRTSAAEARGEITAVERGGAAEPGAPRSMFEELHRAFAERLGVQIGFSEAARSTLDADLRPRQRQACPVTGSDGRPRSDDFDDFGRAIKLKLLREIRQLLGAVPSQPSTL